MNFKKAIFNIFKYLIFLSFGIFLFLKVTERYKFKDLLDQLQNYNYWYIFIAVAFNVLSNISRAIRWNFLLEPLGYKVKVFNAFISVQIMYLANFFVPRGGEVARCGVLAKTDDVPFSKLVGTVIVERAIDTLTLLLLAFIVFITQLSTLKKYLVENFTVPGKSVTDIFGSVYFILGILIIVLSLDFVFIFRKKIKQSKIFEKIRSFYFNFIEGIKSIARLKKPFKLIFHTIFIYVMWLLMMVTFFKGFAPTQNISEMSVLTVFVVSSLSMILPVPAGMGAFHFAVASGLVLYGIHFEIGAIIAFIMHTSINLYLNIFGILAFIYFLYLVFIKSKNNTGT